MPLLNDCRFQITNLAGIYTIAAIGKFSSHMYLIWIEGKRCCFHSPQGYLNESYLGGAAIGLDISSMPGILGIQAY